MSKLIITADFHLGITPSAKIASMVQQIVERRPDAVVVAGDLGENLRLFANCLELLKPIGCPVGIVAAKLHVMGEEYCVSSQQIPCANG